MWRKEIFGEILRWRIFFKEFWFWWLVVDKNCLGIILSGGRERYGEFFVGGYFCFFCVLKF